MAKTITEQEYGQQIGRQLVRRMNAVLLVSGIVSLLLTIVLASLPFLLYQLLLTFFALVVAIRSHRSNLHLVPYVLSIFLSLVIVWGVSLVGFTARIRK